MTGLGLANPAGALALLALAALLVLHLRRRRRAPVPVATVFLWRRVRMPLGAPPRFRADVLFWLQVAAIGLLGAGYVGPYLERVRAPTPERLLVVLDVSASMQAREAEGTRFELARGRARAELARLDAAAEFMLVMAGTRTAVALPWSADRALARRHLEEAAPLDVPTDLAPALELALGEARARPATRVLVLTDLPPDEAGPDAGDLAALEWVRIGRTDDNVAVAGLVVDPGRWTEADAAPVVVLARNYARVPRTVVLDARAGGSPWARETLELRARDSRIVSLPPPPAAGALEVALLADDALAVDDRAWAWLDAPRPPDAVVATRSPELAATLGRLAATVPGGRVDVVAPEDWSPAAAAGRRLAVLDDFVPDPPPATPGTLYVAPPPGNAVCPAARRADEAALVDWDATHPLLRRLGRLQPLGLARASILEAVPWGAPVVVGAAGATTFPLLLAGETGGRRVACLAPALAGDLLDSDRLPLLLLTLATLEWLDGAGAPLAVATGEAVPAAAGVAPVPGVRVAGDPPALVAERTGLHRLPAPGGERIVAANLFDDRESDIGRAAGGPPPAPPARAATAATTMADLAGWLFALGAAALVAEWGLWIRRGG